MEQSTKSLCLNLGQKETEDSHHKVNLKWKHEDISCLFLLIFQPVFTVKRIWIIDELETSILTLDDAITADSSIRLAIYGLKLTEDDGLFQLVCSACETDYNFQTSGCSSPGMEVKTWELYLETHESPNSILSFGQYSLAGTTDELKITTVFSPPSSYIISPQDPLPGEANIIMFLGKDNTEYIIQTQMAPSGLRIPLTLEPRNSYKSCIIQIDSLDISNRKSYLCLGTSRVFTIKSVMSKEDLRRLQQKAEEYMKKQPKYPSTHEVKVMFRNKPRHEMSAIMEEHNGLMKKYIKDNNGDPYSPVNRNIKGLFFSVSLDSATNNLPDFSFFGNRRLHVPVEALLTDDTNLYFTDFYCTRTDRHYVTVVLTKKHSDTDLFCQGCLLQLDKYNNPFLFRKTGAEVQYHTIWSPQVEVFYTEDVNIATLQLQYGTEQVRFSDTTTRGRGRSLPDGIPKRSLCPHCNL